jgi:hypothetical protein
MTLAFVLTGMLRGAGGSAPGPKLPALAGVRP